MDFKRPVENEKRWRIEQHSKGKQECKRLKIQLCSFLQKNASLCVIVHKDPSQFTVILFPIFFVCLFISTSRSTNAFFAVSPVLELSLIFHMMRFSASLFCIFTDIIQTISK